MAKVVAALTGGAIARLPPLVTGSWIAATPARPCTCGCWKRWMNVVGETCPARAVSSRCGTRYSGFFSRSGPAGERSSGFKPGRASDWFLNLPAAYWCLNLPREMFHSRQKLGLVPSLNQRQVETVRPRLASTDERRER